MCDNDCCFCFRLFFPLLWLNGAFSSLYTIVQRCRFIVRHCAKHAELLCKKESVRGFSWSILRANFWVGSCVLLCDNFMCFCFGLFWLLLFWNWAFRELFRIVRNCAGIVLRLCVEGGVWLVIFVRGRVFFVEHFLLFLFWAASAVAFAGQALQKSVQNCSPSDGCPKGKRSQMGRGKPCSICGRPRCRKRYFFPLKCEFNFLFEKSQPPNVTLIFANKTYLFRANMV